MGIKAGDDMVIPLCHNCHMHLHASGNETEFLANWGMKDPVTYAGELYKKYKKQLD